MNRHFGNYNDYEILYLIKDGNEKALEFMFKKYDIHIFKIASSLYFKSDKINDLIQEGRMVLYDCICRFNENQRVSFHAYFTICLKRTYYRLLKTDYYTGLLVNEDDVPLDKLPDINKKSDYRGSYFFTDEFYIKLFDECLMGGLTISDFAKEHNISYNTAYYKYKRMVLTLKQLFSLD